MADIIDYKIIGDDMQAVIITLDPGERVIAEAADIDTLLVGTGKNIVPLAPALKERLRGERIVAEAMSTGAAVRTFNVLLAESRAVAAAPAPSAASRLRFPR